MNNIYIFYILFAFVAIYLFLLSDSCSYLNSGHLIALCNNNRVKVIESIQVYFAPCIFLITWDSLCRFL